MYHQTPLPNKAAPAISPPGGGAKKKRGGATLTLQTSLGDGGWGVLGRNLKGPAAGARPSVVNVDMSAADPTFTPYGLTHWALLALTVIGAVLLVRFGRRHRDTPLAERFTRIFAVVQFAVTLGSWLSGSFRHCSSWSSRSPPPVRRPATGHGLCAVEPAARALALTYYWGLTLNPQRCSPPTWIGHRPSPGVRLLLASACVGDVGCHLPDMGPRTAPELAQLPAGAGSHGWVGRGGVSINLLSAPTTAS